MFLLVAGFRFAAHLSPQGRHCHVRFSVLPFWFVRGVGVAVQLIRLSTAKIIGSNPIRPTERGDMNWTAFWATIMLFFTALSIGSGLAVIANGINKWEYALGITLVIGGVLSGAFFMGTIYA